MLFGFLNDKKGKLYRQFKKLDPQKLIKELDVERWDPKQIVFITYKLALYGGLHIQNTLREKKTITYANQDRIFIEGTAYTWANINSMLSTRMRSALSDEKTILQGVLVGGGVLAEMLSKHSGLSVGSDFYKPYQKESAVEAFSDRLLRIPKSKDKDPLKDRTLVAVASQIFTDTIQKGILGSVEAMIQMYLKRGGRKNVPPMRVKNGSGISSEQLFTLCIRHAKMLHLKVAEFDPPLPNVEGFLSDMINDLEKDISRQCLLHCYALITHCMLKKNGQYLGTKLDSEFGTSIMSNLVELDMNSFNLPGATQKDRNSAISRQKQQMKEAVELAIHMLSNEKYEGVSVFEAGVKLFCSRLNKSKPEHLQAIERISQSIVAETDKVVS
tara:strand:- start:1164 stop:2318 length:1155 start_codon:yes stop_codon:yes gene_type:complete